MSKKSRQKRREAQYLIDPELNLEEGSRVVEPEFGDVGVITCIINRVADVRWEDGREGCYVLEHLRPAR